VDEPAERHPAGAAVRAVIGAGFSPRGRPRAR
jgi:hypothetical protein